MPREMVVSDNRLLEDHRTASQKSVTHFVFAAIAGFDADRPLQKVLARKRPSQKLAVAKI